jgi:polysaccharide deacetylase family protein (PEP-CTERM system associated)
VHAADTRTPILLTVDLEDWHQLVGRAIRRPDWDRPHDEFERQMDDTLSLLRGLGVRATFFALGLSARNHPHVIDRLLAEGHEVACHGWAHVPAWRQTPDEFRRDVEAALSVLDAVGAPRPLGYRAPVFSLTSRTPWAHAVLAELGFRYDSSHYDSARIPARLPAARCPYRIEGSGARGILELPIAVTRIADRTLPIGGGSYWRVLPRRLILHGLDELTAARGFPVLYFHPYELGCRALRLALPRGTSLTVRAGGAWKTVRYNPGRGRVVELLAEAAERFHLMPCGEALQEVEDSTRAAAAPVTA